MVPLLYRPARGPLAASSICHWSASMSRVIRMRCIVHLDGCYTHEVAICFSSSTLEQSLDVLLAVVIRGLQIIQFLAQVLELSFHIGCFLCLTCLDVCSGGEDEPIAMVSRGRPAIPAQCPTSCQLHRISVFPWGVCPVPPPTTAAYGFRDFSTQSAT